MIKTENLGDDVIGIILDRPNSSHNFQDEKAISEFYNLLKEIEKKNTLETTTEANKIMQLDISTLEERKSQKK